MAFTNIGFHAALILNRLRNEQRIRDYNGGNDDAWKEDNRAKDDRAGNLAFTNRKALP